MGDLVTAAESGDRAATLKALRDRLAQDIEVCESMRDVAALARQLVLVLADLDSLPNSEVRSSADEIAARRSARRSPAV